MKLFTMSAVAALALTLAGLTSVTRAEEQETIQLSEKQPFGKYLSADEGGAIYLFTADASGKSVCQGACAQVWPPVTTSGKPAAAAEVDPAKLGTIARQDGTTQVTYSGMPLYYYAPDRTAGSTAGENLNQFGGEWYLVSPQGKTIDQD